MPVDTIIVRPGEPTMQASGFLRGVVDVTLTDGRVFTRTIHAVDNADWSLKVAAIGGEVLADVVEIDANDAVGSEEEIAANGESDQAHTCVAYIREAWAQNQARDAWALYQKINNYVTSHSDWVTAKPHLLAAGLGDEEYDRAANAYSYLSNPARAATMADMGPIQSAWDSSH